MQSTKSQRDNVQQKEKKESIIELNYLYFSSYPHTVKQMSQSNRFSIRMHIKSNKLKGTFDLNEWDRTLKIGGMFEENCREDKDGSTQQKHTLKNPTPFPVCTNTVGYGFMFESLSFFRKPSCIFVRFLNSIHLISTLLILISNQTLNVTSTFKDEGKKINIQKQAYYRLEILQI